MATPNFPSYARMITEAYGETRDYGVLRSEMDGGLAKQRARRTKPIVTRTVRVMVTGKSDKLAFDTWHGTAIFGGTGWFTFTDPVDSVSKQGRIVAGALAWSKVAQLWMTNLQIETVG